jgi:aspartate-semialdehyde dehydrogenase
MRRSPIAQSQFRKRTTRRTAVFRIGSSPRCDRQLRIHSATVRRAGISFLVRQSKGPTVFETVAVVGATGAVGRIILELLEARDFPAKQFKLLSSKRSAGTKVTLKGQEITVEELTPESFAGVDLVIASTPDDTARDYLPYAVKAGCKVIDESGYWRMKPEVALVVPEINPQAALDAKGIIASPNCSTTQMVVALKPLHDAAKVKRVIVSTYQATSGAGLQGSADLEAGSKAALAGEEYDYQAFAHPIAFNAIPQIGGHKEDGYTSEELKMVYETRKILEDESIQVNPTCVRIPVSNCHSETITVETERPILPEEARELFSNFPGIEVVDDLDAGVYPMPNNSDGRDEVFIGRIRRDISHPNGLSFWCVSDNLRKGAATNAVQIAELLAKHQS